MNNELRELQMRMLDIVVDIDRMCREHHLRYYLQYGTLLGAVRHKGFIPWDDDIDISMPREDYELLAAHAHEWLPEYLEFKCLENDASYPFAFGKVQDKRTTVVERLHYPYLGGVYCDIFPMDGLPAGRLRRRWQVAKHAFWFRMLYLVHRDPFRHGSGPSSWLPRIVRRFFTMQQVQQHMRRGKLRYPYGESEYTFIADAPYKTVMPKSLFGEGKPVEFEGRMLVGMADNDAYLRLCYGDYMQLPKVEQRHVHNFHYLDMEHPYSEYQGPIGLEHNQ